MASTLTTLRAGTRAIREAVRRNALFGGDELPNHLVNEETVRERIVAGHGQRPEYRDTVEIRRRIREGDHPEVTP